LLSDDDLLGRVDAVNLEYVLGDIQTDRGNLHGDGSPHVIRLRRTTLWHSMPGAGVVHHINICHWQTLFDHRVEPVEQRCDTHRSGDWHLCALALSSPVNIGV
jgi:hypothetical protein